MGRASLQNPRNRRTVLALGGNALIRPGEVGTVGEQFVRVREVAEALRAVQGPLVISHGNGPQVGRVLLRSELCAPEIPEIPLDIAVASTQGTIGLMLQQVLGPTLRRPTVAVLTQCRVDPEDPAFASPTKYIGRFYTREEAERMASERGWQIREDRGRGWRRVVASPRPLEILEMTAIEALLEQDVLVIAAGGGGIPVVERFGAFVGAEAVIDKDRASALLARQLGAGRLIVLTGVDEVMVDFATPKARTLRRVRADELRAHQRAGQFPPGSMGPKIEAALDFLAEDGPAGREVLITSPEQLSAALRGERGTVITT